jgi:hypothetical protein
VEEVEGKRSEVNFYTHTQSLKHNLDFGCYSDCLVTFLVKTSSPKTDAIYELRGPHSLS